MAPIPALLKTRFNANEILTSLMLVYVAQLFLDWLVRGPWRDPQGFNFPETSQLRRLAASLPSDPRAGSAHWGVVFALVAAACRCWFLMARTLTASRSSVLGQARGPGASPAFQPRGMVFFAFLLSGGLAGLAGICEVAGRDRPAAAVDLAGLRLHRDHRRLPRPAQSVGIVARRPGAGADLSRRRGGADRARRLRQGGARLPGHAALLRARLRHPDPLPHPLRAGRRGHAAGRPPHGHA